MPAAAPAKTGLIPTPARPPADQPSMLPGLPAAIQPPVSNLSASSAAARRLRHMNVLFIASMSVVAADPPQSRKLFIDALGLPLEKYEADEYYSSESIPGSKHFGVWPLSQAAEACFGTPKWPAGRVVPQASIEFEVEDAEAVAPGAHRAVGTDGDPASHGGWLDRRHLLRPLASRRRTCLSAGATPARAPRRRSNKRYYRPLRVRVKDRSQASTVCAVGFGRWSAAISDGLRECAR